MDEDSALERQRVEEPWWTGPHLVELFGESEFGVAVGPLALDAPLVWVNAAFAEMLALSPAEARRLSAGETLAWLHPDDVGAVRARLETTGRAGPASGPLEVRLRGAGDQERWVQLTTQTVRDGELEMRVRFLSDITERKRVEQELRRERRLLREQAAEAQRQNEELRAVIGEIRRERARLAKLVEANVRLLVTPQIERLRVHGTSALRPELDALERSIAQLGSELGLELAQVNPALTPRELEVCSLIRAGLRTGAIARALGLSRRSVETHRYNIRTKLGLRGKDANLASHLAYLDR